MKIKLHIERLVLDGLPVSRLHGPLVQAAVERELTRLLMHGGLSHELRRGGAIAAVRGESIRLARQNQAGALGEQIGRAVYGSIGSKANARNTSGDQQ